MKYGMDLQSVLGVPLSEKAYNHQLDVVRREVSFGI